VAGAVADGSVLRFAYDASGNRTSVKDGAGRETTTAPAGRTIGDPSVTRAYDDAGRITAITDWRGRAHGVRLRPRRERHRAALSQSDEGRDVV
jgi:YD repeat-containing protein